MVSTRLPTTWRLGLILLLGLIAWSGGAGPAAAQQFAFRSYGEAEGLTNGWFSCLHQDPAGYVFACTEHGIYVYDGRRYSNLGAAQGLPDGGAAIGLVFTTDGRLIVRYPHGIFVSTTPVGPHTPPEAVWFRQATSQLSSVPDGTSGQMVPWRDGGLFAAHGALYTIETGDRTAPPSVRIVTASLNRSGIPLHDKSPIAADGSTIWAVRRDGSICGFDTAAGRCYGAADGLPSDQWVALLPTADGHVLARSPSRLADIDTRSGHVDTSLLPDQGGRYDNYPTMLLLALTPSGHLITQSADGLMVRRASGWENFTTRNGLPSAPILQLMFDRDDELWLGVVGRGVLRARGYGVWDTFDHHDGISDDMLWQMARQPNGPLWVASDGGVDALAIPPGMVPKQRHYDMAAFSVVTDNFGHLWRSVGSNTIACITLETGATVEYPLLKTSQILHGAGNRLWFIAGTGVYAVDAGPVPAAPQPIPDLSGPVTTAAAAADGSLWVLRRQLLMHRHVDGAMVVLHPRWQAGSEPDTLAVAGSGPIWAAGTGTGLYRLQVIDDRITSTTLIQPPDIISNSVVSLLVDSRGWLWVGTDRGISAFNGRRWVSATSNNGMVWNDQDQGGLFEDTDGSMWFASSQGLSHLLKPARLFDIANPGPVITSATVGDTIYRERAVPYSHQPLVIQFGTLDFRNDDVIHFRYRLDGVDAGWAENWGGYARYPYVPPGRHRFELVAYNPLTHAVSAPVSILLRMQQPWWLWWPMLFLYVAAAVAALSCGLQLRFRFLLRQRRNLQRQIELRTAEIRDAQATDSLTRLLTRGETQSRLVAALARGDRTSQITIGLLDIDHFKRINDRFGHLVGDDILEEIGRRLKLALRTGEYAGRYGGEEILIVIESEDGPGGDRFETLNAAVCGSPFPVDGMVINITCSIGVAFDHPCDTWKSLVGRADQALYQAKADGRDRIVVSATVVSIKPPDRVQKG